MNEITLKEDHMFLHSCKICGEQWFMNSNFFLYCPYCGYKREKSEKNCLHGNKKGISVSDPLPYKCNLHLEPTFCSSCLDWKPITIKDYKNCYFGYKDIIVKEEDEIFFSKCKMKYDVPPIGQYTCQDCSFWRIGDEQEEEM